MNTMKMYLSGILLIVFINLFCHSISAQSQIVQDNPLLILHTSTIPTIDGIGSDSCWQAAKWQSIGKVWIPFNGSVSDSDYTGRYKVMWSSETNLLYFLIEIHDDVFVDGYVPSTNGGSYNYDISEVFIDENHSGGEHRYDGPTTNAENAFAYHIYASYPSEGEENTSPYIEDMVGMLTDSKWVNHASHFPEFSLRKTGNACVREFSLIVYNDAYTEENKEGARVKLQAGKVMGLSVAYCDNDHPEINPKVRDNMYGSVVEPFPGNLHWMNADYFGPAELTDDFSTGINITETIPADYALYQNYPNPFNPITKISYSIIKTTEVTLKVYDILGSEIRTLINRIQVPGHYTVTFDARDLTSGVYFYKIRAGSFIGTKKSMLLK
ncbi:MAG: sugar-binding protein [Ignavibacteriaceae bacterium]